jgi:hypothetical protein
LIEDFIAGDEFSVDAIVSDSVLEILAIFEKTGSSRWSLFLKRRSYVTPPRISIARVS